MLEVFVLIALLLLLSQYDNEEINKKIVNVPFKQETVEFIQPLKKEEKVLFVKPVERIIVFEN